MLLPLDYISLAMDALLEVDIPPEFRERLIPTTLTAVYKPYETRMERTHTLFVTLFDPYDVPRIQEGPNLWARGYSVLINPEGNALYRGRAGFGSTPRLEQIQEMLVQEEARE